MSDLPTSALSEVPSPVLVASWERLGLLATDRVPMWAAYWIAGGRDGQALRYLAGLHGDDPREVHDALPEALMDCGVQMPDSDVAAAAVVFTHIARLHVNGLVGPLRATQQVSRIVDRSTDSAGMVDLPLGKLYCLDWEWLDCEQGAVWGRSIEELAAVIREACEEQLRSDATA
jgi:hypothetical protein